MRKKFLILILSAVAAACGSGDGSGNSATNTAETTNRPAANSSAGQTANAETVPANANAETAENTAIPTKAECEATNTGDNVVLKPQTYPIDFAPFAGSCFVTSHNPEFEDPPMESEFAIYRDGKSVFKFPGQFNGATFGCWVSSVAFADLNDDGKKDIIVAGKCSARESMYNENMVYMNTGEEFTTSEAANSLLVDQSTTRAIAQFAKANPDKFFK